MSFKWIVALSAVSLICTQALAKTTVSLSNLESLCYAVKTQKDVLDMTISSIVAAKSKLSPKDKNYLYYQKCDDLDNVLSEAQVLRDHLDQYCKKLGVK